MIGYVGKGSSFFDCIRYCLEDKKELSEEQKQQLSQKDHLQHKDRAEILFYNKCFGNKYELAEDFKEVAKLSKRVEKPVFYFSLRLAPGEVLPKDQLMEIGRECAKKFKVADKELLYVLNVITVGCQVLDDIYHNIWEFANGHIDEIHAEDIELAKWLPSIIDLYRPLAKDKDIQISLRINNDKGFTIVSDKLKLTRIISNLLNNAIDYTPIGKSISIRSYTKNNLLYIEIQVEGEGIPDDKLRDIFQPYVRLQKKRQGMCIGLTICEVLIGQLQGNITVASVLSEGSIFTVILPISPL